MEKTQTTYTEADKAADRARYLRLQALKVESRAAAYLQSLGWPSAPWTDGDHKRFTDASDRWDGAYSKEYRAEGGAA